MLICQSSFRGFCRCCPSFPFRGFRRLRRIGVNRKTGAWRALVGHKIDGWLLGYQLVVVWMGCIAGGPRMGVAAATVVRRAGTKEMGAAAV